MVPAGCRPEGGYDLAAARQVLGADAVHALQDVQLFGRLDAFGHHAYAEAGAQLDRAEAQRGVPFESVPSGPCPSR